MVKRRSPEARAAALALLEKYKTEHAEEYAEAQAARERRLANLAAVTERHRAERVELGRPAPGPPRKPYCETSHHMKRQAAEARRAERRAARAEKQAQKYAENREAIRAKLEKPARSPGRVR